MLSCSKTLGRSKPSFTSPSRRTSRCFSTIHNLAATSADLKEPTRSLLDCSVGLRTASSHGAGAEVHAETGRGRVHRQNTDSRILPGEEPVCEECAPMFWRNTLLILAPLQLYTVPFCAPRHFHCSRRECTPESFGTGPQHLPCFLVQLREVVVQLFQQTFFFRRFCRGGRRRRRRSRRSLPAVEGRRSRRSRGENPRPSLSSTRRTRGSSAHSRKNLLKTKATGSTAAVFFGFPFLDAVPATTSAKAPATQGFGLPLQLRLVYVV